jgi:hypothetical protein
MAVGDSRNTRPSEDRVIEFDGDCSKFLGCGHNDYADEFFEPFVSGQSPASNPVYKLLKARTGLTLGGLRRAFVGSQVHWLVCEGVVVLPPDSRKRKARTKRKVSKRRG